ncbi:hypothetical protein [Paludibaculum fermentans]|uniref:hypothetical protein n=1 Tax=Paludibaculum fermentans TaxID=1473598 RepID=UPI003EB6F345
MWCRLVLGALLCFPASGALLVYQATIHASIGDGSPISMPGFPSGLGTLEAYFLDWKLTGGALALHWPEPWSEETHVSVITYECWADAILLQPFDPEIKLHLGPGIDGGTGMVGVGLDGSAHGRSRSSGPPEGVTGWLSISYEQHELTEWGYFDPPIGYVVLDLTLVYKYVEYGAIPEPGTGLLTGGPLILVALALARRHWSQRKHRLEMRGEPAPRL